MMKLNLTLTLKCLLFFLLTCLILIDAQKTNAQSVCTTPNATIYGLTSNGAIYPITVSNAAVGSVIKNTSYSGNSPSNSNAISYNSTNGKFYYFKRNVGSSPTEFVSYDPATATVAALNSTTPFAVRTHTAAITADGKGYYTVATNGSLSYYDIINNTWTLITNQIYDEKGNNVSLVIQSQNAGDVAFDGNGNLWIVTSNNSNYGVYCLLNPPKTFVSSLTVYQRVDPSSTTPSGNSFAGIAFNSTGQIYMSTYSNDQLYRLENDLTLTYIGSFSVTNIGNDLTSCVFPMAVLPVTWIDFSAILKNNKEVNLSWQIAEKPYAGFYVQNSHDGKTWSDIAFVESLESDVEGKIYKYTHKNPAAGQNYYRIKTLNELRKERYSEVNAVLVKQGGSEVAIWPNPASENINISGSMDQLRTVRIFDLSGRIQLNAQLIPGENTIAVNKLKSGTYMLMIYSANGTKESKTFIKQ